ncbi:MAG TPA: tyrosine-type recombinase/integrase [Acidimicrobiales bacterium]|nr:tyrosine-type recombinase/integrase [Acidimicrobiales bacterium]
MAGHLYQLPGEKGWRVQIDVGIDPATGRRVRVKLPGRGKPPFAAKREAEQAAARVLVERSDGAVVDSRYTTVSEFLLERWLPARKARGIRPSTVAGYEWAIRRYVVPKVGALKLKDLRPDHVARMITDLATEPGRYGRPRSARTIEVARKVLGMALADAVRWGILSRNPVDAAKPDLVRLGGPKRPPTIWTKQQLGQFLRSVEAERDFALWRLAATTGMRRGELCGLEWGDVDLHGRHLFVRRARVMVGGGYAMTQEPKTPAGVRKIGLDEVTVEALRAHKRLQEAERRACPPGQWKECDNVFRDQLGRPVFPESLTKRFRVLTLGAGLPPIRLHDIRHSYATAFLQSGLRVETLADRLGHSTATITRSIYLHPVEDLDREAAEIVARLITDDQDGD